MSTWYRDRHFSMIRSSKIDMVAVITNPKELQRVIDEHNALEAEVFNLREKLEQALQQINNLRATR